MQILKASRKKVKMRFALQGPAGSGKTYSALLIAYGLCGDWNKIVIIDTENQSADLYSHLGEYNVLALTAPFTPEKYIEAIAFCEKTEIQVIIIDSISHEWEGAGGIVDTHSKMAGNSFTNWAKVNPRHNSFLQAILNSKAHIIATLRKKQDYILTEKNGKMVPEKVGLKAIQRDGTDYEFTLVFDLDIQHNAYATKDRTGLFLGRELKLNNEVGEMLAKWCEEGIAGYPQSNEQDNIIEQIHECRTVEELAALYKNHPSYQETLLSHFTSRKKQLQGTTQLLPHFQNHSTNGITH